MQTVEERPHGTSFSMSWSGRIFCSAERRLGAKQRRHEKKADATEVGFIHQCVLCGSYSVWAIDSLDQVEVSRKASALGSNHKTLQKDVHAAEQELLEDIQRRTCSLQASGLRPSSARFTLLPCSTCIEILEDKIFTDWLDDRTNSETAIPLCPHMVVYFENAIPPAYIRKAGKWSLAQGVGPKETSRDLEVKLPFQLPAGQFKTLLPPTSPPLRPPCWPKKGDSHQDLPEKWQARRLLLEQFFCLVSCGWNQVPSESEEFRRAPRIGQAGLRQYCGSVLRRFHMLQRVTSRIEWRFLGTLENSWLNLQSVHPLPQGGLQSFSTCICKMQGDWGRQCYGAAFYSATSGCSEINLHVSPRTNNWPMVGILGNLFSMEKLRKDKRSHDWAKTKKQSLQPPVTSGGPRVTAKGQKQGDVRRTRYNVASTKVLGNLDSLLRPVTPPPKLQPPVRPVTPCNTARPATPCRPTTPCYDSRTTSQT
eukprot:s568_g17.t9